MPSDVVLIPDSVMRSKIITSEQKIIFSLLLQFDEEKHNTPSNDTIAFESGCTLDEVTEALTALETEGLIVVNTKEKIRTITVPSNLCPFTRKAIKNKENKNIPYPWEKQ